MITKEISKMTIVKEKVWELTDKEREIILMLEYIKHNAISDNTGIFTCPNKGCTNCPFTNENGCSWLQLEKVISKILEEANTIEKGEAICN